MAYHFNNRIKVIDLVPASGPEAGGTQEVVIAQPWCDIKTMQGREIQTMGTTSNEISSRFITRYRSDIKARHKIKFKDEIYNIESITNDDERNLTLTIIAKAET